MQVRRSGEPSERVMMCYVMERLQGGRAAGCTIHRNDVQLDSAAKSMGRDLFKSKLKQFRGVRSVRPQAHRMKNKKRKK